MTTYVHSQIANTAGTSRSDITGVLIVPITIEGIELRAAGTQTIALLCAENNTTTLMNTIPDLWLASQNYQAKDVTML